MLSDHDEQIGEAAYADRKVHWALLRTDLDIRFPPSDSFPLLRFGRWDDQPHQHLPASRLAASHWKGMLIADEVGLGKTISALHVLRRLHVLGERGGVLIVVPGGLRSKWMQELYHRTDLQGFEADTGAKLRQALQTIEEGEPLVVVTSHGILRQSSLVSELLENGMPEMMLSIVDEAHHVRQERRREVVDDEVAEVLQLLGRGAASGTGHAGDDHQGSGLGRAHRRVTPPRSRRSRC